jgi:2-dehydropantoate 2-reductase
VKIAVMGAGALGGYFGGRLAQSGHDVWLIARGAHLKALQDDGLRIISPKGDAHIKKISATNDPADVGEAEIVLFMVKNIDVEPAAQAIKPMLGTETMVVTCQNGVTAWKRLANIVGDKHVVPGVARTPGQISKPGTIKHTATLDMLLFGEIDGSRSERCETLHNALSEAGSSPVIADNILHELWSKFCGQSALASLATLTGLDIGPLRDNEVSARLFKDAIVEAIQVGRAAVDDLPDDLLQKNWDFVTRLPATMHASMLDDLRQGKPLEHEYLSGDVVRLGRQYGVPTPIHSTLYAALKPRADQLAMKQA